MKVSLFETSYKKGLSRYSIRKKKHLYTLYLIQSVTIVLYKYNIIEYHYFPHHSNENFLMSWKCHKENKMKINGINTLYIATIMNIPECLKNVFKLVQFVHLNESAREHLAGTNMKHLTLKCVFKCNPL